VERAGLACAVGADHGEDLTGFHREAEPVDGLHAAELQAKVLDLQQNAHRLSSPSTVSRSSFADGSGTAMNPAVGGGAGRCFFSQGSTAVDGHSPDGRNSMTTTSSTPKIRKRHSEKSRSSSGASDTNSAPMITPGVEPIPPSTTAMRMSAEYRNRKLFGLMADRWVAIS